MNKTQLTIGALSKLIIGLSIIALLLFIPAGTWYYWHAWLLIALLFIPMLCMGIGMLIFSPELLAKRLNNKEKEQTQKYVVSLSGLMFIGGFIVCGLDYRFAWSQVPLWMIITGSVLFIIGYVLYAEVLRENA